MYANGRCDEGCNTPACNWDGLDCDTSEKRLALGTLVIVVGIPPEQFRNESRLFLRKLGNLLRAVVFIKTDQYGADMIYPWYNKDKLSRFRREYMSNTVGVTSEPGDQPDG